MKINVSLVFSAVRLGHWIEEQADLIALLCLTLAFSLYVHYGNGHLLHFDEAMHYLMANHTSLKEAYLYSRSLAHPPLLILLLYVLKPLGNSIFFLHSVSAVLSALAGWWAFRWMRRAFGPAEALLGLLLLAFSPAMVYAACEIRQYALLLFFSCGALYFLHRFLEDEDLRAGILGWALLYGAILSHYSAAWIVLALAVHVGVSVWRHPDKRMFRLWAAAQAGAASLYAWLYFSHVRGMFADSIVQINIQSYLKSGYFFPKEESALSFIARSTRDVFAYFCGFQGPAIPLLICFLAGLFLLSKRPGPLSAKPRHHPAILLSLPFILGCGGALLGVLPFGGSRHISGLLPFIAAGIAVGAARLLARRRVWLCLCLGILCVWLTQRSWLPRFAEPKMSAGNMETALQKLHEEVPAGEVLFVDDSTHFLLTYYLSRNIPCQGKMYSSDIGGYRMLWPRSSHFTPEVFDRDLIVMARSIGLRAGTLVNLMFVCWGNEEEMETFLTRCRLGDQERKWRFGPIFLLRIQVPKTRRIL
ncbi:MAG: glycosyltransferase family 39 protein [Elusimicrobiota bacterium]